MKEGVPAAAPLTAASEELFRFHLAQVRELGGYLCGCRLYETMLVRETDPSLRDNDLRVAFADVSCAIPKAVFSRTLYSVQGNARLAEASLGRGGRCGARRDGQDVAIGGAGLAAAAVELGLVDELRVFRIRSSSVAARRSCRRLPKMSRWT